MSPFIMKKGSVRCSAASVSGPQVPSGSFSWLDCAHPIFVAAADHGRQIVRHVIRRDDYLFHPKLSQREDLNFQHRTLANRQQWLGNDIGEGAKAHTQPAREDDSQLNRH